MAVRRKVTKRAAAPTKLGAMIDKLYATRQKRLEASRKVDALKRDEAEQEQRIITEMNKLDIEQARGSKASASISAKRFAQIEDWDLLCQYVAETKSFDLLQRRGNVTALEERLEAGRGVPGMALQSTQKLGLRKK